MLSLSEIRNCIQDLDKADEPARRHASNSLKPFKESDWSAVPAAVVNSLIESLLTQIRSGAKQWSVRQDAVIILGNLGARAEPAIPVLTELLQDGVNDGLRESAAAALGKIGKAARVAVNPLVALLSNGRATLVILAVRALSEIGCGDERVRKALTNLWLPAAPSQKLQMQLALAFCKLKIEATGLVRYLTATLMVSQDTALRKAAAEALGWCDPDEVNVVPALLAAALKDKDEGVNQVAEAALVKLHLSRDKAIALCAKQLKQSPYAEAALRNSGQPAVLALVEALKAEEPEARVIAVRILGSLSELAADAVPALTATLRNKDLGVRLAAAKSLWHITKKTEDVIPVFVDLLEDKWATSFEAGESRRRFLQAVIESLGRIGPPAKAAVPALTHKAKDKNRLISESALTALKEIAPAVAEKAVAR